MKVLGELETIQGMELVSSLEELSATREDVIIDSRKVSKSELYAWRQQHPTGKVYYLVEEKDPVLDAFARAQDVQLVLSGDIPHLLRGQTLSDQPVLALWGVVPRVGTTLLALALGRVMTEMHGGHVGVIGLNGYNPGFWMLKEQDHALDDVLSSVRTKRIDGATLQTAMVTMSHKLSYLPGLRNALHALEFQPEDVQFLLSVAKRTFDVVIVDVGSVLNTALALEGIRQATHRYCVSSDRFSAQQQYFQQMDYCLKPMGLSSEHWMLVGNQLYGKQEVLAKSLGMLPVAGIAYQDRFDMYAEQQPDPIQYFLDDRRTKKALETIVTSVIDTKRERVVK
ncbi:AAA family ATPase [Alicyclobacillus tolerans]|uniref:AAA family ATPase n=1 Tax=Alicyclobacillus tolerans TaxID=90970 RepID=UPI003B808627